MYERRSSLDEPDSVSFRILRFSIRMMLTLFRYCDCGASAHYSTMSFPTTISNYASAICDFTDGVPSKTIEPITTTAPPTNIPGMNGLGQCRLMIANGVESNGCPGVDYCDCNGVYVQPKPSTSVATPITSGGNPTTTVVPNCNYITLQPTAQDCPINTAAVISASMAAAASASQSKAAYPTASATCFPYHDVNDLKIEGPDVNGGCRGTNADWELVDGIDPASAAAANYVRSGYTLADDAPPECHNLYAQGHSDYVTELCSAPLAQILNDCPYNGGKVTNACGEWWMQTCPLEETCPVGCPGGNFPVGDSRCGSAWPPPS